MPETGVWSETIVQMVGRSEDLPCTNEIFGNPAWKEIKHCQCALPQKLPLHFPADAHIVLSNETAVAAVVAAVAALQAPAPAAPALPAALLVERGVDYAPKHNIGILNGVETVAQAFVVFQEQLAAHPTAVAGFVYDHYKKQLWLQDAAAFVGGAVRNAKSPHQVSGFRVDDYEMMAGATQVRTQPPRARRLEPQHALVAPLADAWRALPPRSHHTPHSTPHAHSHSHSHSHAHLHPLHSQYKAALEAKLALSDETAVAAVAEALLVASPPLGAMLLE